MIENPGAYPYGTWRSEGSRWNHPSSGESNGKENAMETLGPLKGVYRDIRPPLMENQIEKNMDNLLETG